MKFTFKLQILICSLLYLQNYYPNLIKLLFKFSVNYHSNVVDHFICSSSLLSLVIYISWKPLLLLSFYTFLSTSSTSLRKGTKTQFQEKIKMISQYFVRFPKVFCFKVSLENHSLQKTKFFDKFYLLHFL